MSIKDTKDIKVFHPDALDNLDNPIGLGLLDNLNIQRQK
jgi:hypothetical protein